MKKKIKVIPVQTNSDTLMSLQISKSKTYGCNNKLVSQEWEMSIVLNQELGLDDDGCLVTTLKAEQIDKLIGQLVCAKAEIENKNKSLQLKKIEDYERGSIIKEAGGLHSGPARIETYGTRERSHDNRTKGKAVGHQTRHLEKESSRGQD